MRAGALVFLLTASLGSYIPWILRFGIYRYPAPLEWLAPLAIVLIPRTLLPPRYRMVGLSRCSC